jgi:hypothetical protein
MRVLARSETPLCSVLGNKKPQPRSRFFVGGADKLREMLIKFRFVIPAKAGIQENLQAGHRPTPV